MHYKNGREAKVGDSVVGKDWNGFPVSGVVVKTTEGEGCNLYVMPTGTQGVPVYTAGEFIHLDDALDPTAAAPAVVPTESNL